MTVTVPMVLRRAAEIIGVNGWHRSYFYDQIQAAETGLDPSACRVCAVGAVLLAAGVAPLWPIYFDLSQSADKAAAEALLTLGLHLDLYKPGIDLEAAADLADDVLGMWNDVPGRTAEMVRAALNAAAGDAP